MISLSTRGATLPKLLSQPPETLLVNQFVERKLIWEQIHRLNSEMQPLDIDFALRTVSRHD